MPNGTLLFVGALILAAVLYWMALRFPHDGRPFSRFRTCLSLLRLFLRPSGSSTITLYEMWGNHEFSESNRFINMGYWHDASNLDDAGRLMAELLAEKARLKPGDLVVDVGFGFGDQDVLWMETFRPEKIIGLNITPSQVHSARTLVDKKRLSHRIDLREGSATSMPLPDNSSDVILALECALHFETREAFFREAARVLKDGGCRTQKGSGLFFRLKKETRPNSVRINTVRIQLVETGRGCGRVSQRFNRAHPSRVRESLPSVCSLAAHPQRSFRRDVARVAIGRFWSQYYFPSLQRSANFRGRLPRNRLMDVNYRELMLNRTATMNRLARQPGLEFVPSRNPSISRAGSHSYCLEQFGLNEREVIQRFAFCSPCIPTNQT